LPRSPPRLSPPSLHDALPIYPPRTGSASSPTPSRSGWGPPRPDAATGAIRPLLSSQVVQPREQEPVGRPGPVRRGRLLPIVGTSGPGGALARPGDREGRTAQRPRRAGEEGEGQPARRSRGADQRPQGRLAGRGDDGRAQEQHGASRQARRAHVAPVRAVTLTRSPALVTASGGRAASRAPSAMSTGAMSPR